MQNVYVHTIFKILPYQWKNNRVQNPIFTYKMEVKLNSIGGKLLLTFVMNFLLLNSFWSVRELSKDYAPNLYCSVLYCNKNGNKQIIVAYICLFFKNKEAKKLKKCNYIGRSYVRNRYIRKLQISGFGPSNNVATKDYLYISIRLPVKVFYWT